VKQVELRSVEALRKELSMLKTKQELRKAARQAAIDEDDFNEAMDADGWEKAGVELIIAAKFADHKSQGAASGSITTVVSSSASTPTSSPVSAASPKTQAQGTDTRRQRHRKTNRGCCASKPPKS
jgi:Xaa-Pro aminopeptidase